MILLYRGFFIEFNKLLSMNMLFKTNSYLLGKIIITLIKARHCVPLMNAQDTF